MCIQQVHEHTCLHVLIFLIQISFSSLLNVLLNLPTPNEKADYLNCIIEIRVPNTYCKNIRIQEQTFNLNSALIVSKSLTGSTESSTWMMSESSNAPIRLSGKIRFQRVLTTKPQK